MALRTVMARSVQAHRPLGHSDLCGKRRSSAWCADQYYPMGWPKASQEICLRVCSAAESQELNYRGKDQPTNVLSFGFMQTDSNANDAPVAASGEVDLPLGSGPVLARPWPRPCGRARIRGSSTHLFLHGVLHLLGYDHENDADAQAMEQIEIQTGVPWHC